MSLCLLRTITVAALVAAASYHARVNADNPAWSARVGPHVILVQDVDRELARAMPMLPKDEAITKKLREAALAQCVREALALAWLTGQGKVASDADVDLALSRRKKEVLTQGQTWEQYLAKLKHSDATFKREMKWRLSWSRYLEGQLTDANLQRYFERHKAEFDGTQLRVAHILFKSPTEKDAAQIAAVRQEIVQGKTTFAEGAKKHSQSPTATQGGDIGFIERHKPMPEAFARAAFALKPGEVSAPVETTFGLHFVTVLETKPGTGKWQESREELRRAVTEYLFNWISDRQREQVKVEYADAATVPPKAAN